MHYEIHITVQLNALAHILNKFKEDCDKIGVKPITIRLSTSPFSLMDQTMTSSKHTNNDYALTALNQVLALQKLGYKALRVKVEIMPEIQKHTNHLYYESHIRLKIPKKIHGSYKIILDEQLDIICKRANLHKSRNLFKEDDKYFYQMLTYRLYSGTHFDFITHIDWAQSMLNMHHLEYDKVEIEECIYDSNESLDKNWILKC